jgi:hypothetical protein
VVHVSRGKVAQKPSQSRFGPTEIEIMTKAAEQRSLPLARLPGIDLPRMNIEDRLRAVGTVCVGQLPAGEAGGEKAEEATSRSRQIDPEHADHSQRHLDQTGKRREDCAGSVGGSVEIMLSRIHAGTVLKAFFPQDCVSP